MPRLRRNRSARSSRSVTVRLISADKLACEYTALAQTPGASSWAQIRSESSALLDHDRGGGGTFCCRKPPAETETADHAFVLCGDFSLGELRRVHETLYPLVACKLPLAAPQSAHHEASIATPSDSVLHFANVVAVAWSKTDAWDADQWCRMTKWSASIYLDIDRFDNTAQASPASEGSPAAEQDCFPSFVGRADISAPFRRRSASGSASGTGSASGSGTGSASGSGTGTGGWGGNGRNSPGGKGGTTGGSIQVIKFKRVFITPCYPHGWLLSEEAAPGKRRPGAQLANGGEGEGALNKELEAHAETVRRHRSHSHSAGPADDAVHATRSMRAKLRRAVFVPSTAKHTYRRGGKKEIPSIVSSHPLGATNVCDTLEDVHGCFFEAAESRGGTHPHGGAAESKEEDDGDDGDGGVAEAKDEHDGGDQLGEVRLLLQASDLGVGGACGDWGGLTRHHNPHSRCEKSWGTPTAQSFGSALSRHAVFVPAPSAPPVTRISRPISRTTPVAFSVRGGRSGGRGGKGRRISPPPLPSAQHTHLVHQRAATPRSGPRPWLSAHSVRCGTNALFWAVARTTSSVSV